jgi:thioredoxin 1
MRIEDQRMVAMQEDSTGIDDRHTPCPKCGYESSNPEVCDACGAIFSRVRVRQARQEVLDETLGVSGAQANAYGRPLAQPPSPLPGILGTIAVFAVVFLIVYRVLGPGAAPTVSGSLPEDLRVSGDEKAVMVEFWAPWCGPCKVFGPIVDEIAGDYRGKLKVVRINVDEQQATAAQFKVSAIPTTVILDRDGRVVQRVTGLTSKQELSSLIDRSIAE